MKYFDSKINMEVHFSFIETDIIGWESDDLARAHISLKPEGLWLL